MRCNKCQDQLYEYFDGTLTPSRRESIREHLAQCPACFSAFEQERLFSNSMTVRLEQQTRELRLAPQIRGNVIARLQEPRRRNKAFGRLPQEILKIAALIAILLAGFYGGNIWRQKIVTDIRSKSEKETDWHYILVSSRTCYFLNQPELQLRQGGEKKP